jgi:hypothetical protein
MKRGTYITRSEAISINPINNTNTEFLANCIVLHTSIRTHTKSVLLLVVSGTKTTARGKYTISSSENLFF